MSVEPPCQRLIFKGKQLNAENTLFDYGVNFNDCIQLWVMAPAPVKQDDDKSEVTDKEPEKEKPKTVIIEEKTAKLLNAPPIISGY